MRQEEINLIDWIERRKAQVWYDDKKGEWTVFARNEGSAYPSQPSAPSLREALKRAIVQSP